MIYYPLSVLMLARDSGSAYHFYPRDLPVFKALFGSGDTLGMRFEYAMQRKAPGLADAFIVGEHFIGNDNVALIAGR